MARNVVLTLAALAALGAGVYCAWLWWPKGPSDTTAPPVTPPRSREALPVPDVRFTDFTKAAGVTFRHYTPISGKKLLPETMGGGVAIFDYDGDGHQDILFLSGGPWPGSDVKGPPTPVLYRNKGDGTFEDVTVKVGLNVPMFGMGVTVGDFDNDGFDDVFISCVGKHHLFRNVDGKRFEDVTNKAGVGGGPDLPAVSKEKFLGWEKPIQFGASCTFLDYDGDGLLDLFVCHYVTWSPAIDLSINSTLGGDERSYGQPKDFTGALCRLYRNVGKGEFKDVSKEAGVAVTYRVGIGAGAPAHPVGKSLGVIVCDADGDGFPDVIVANDSVRNFFFHNVKGSDGQRRFEECGQTIGAAYADGGTPRGGMGIDWGEHRPGRHAALITNFSNEPNTFLQLEDRKNLRFSDAALAVCVSGQSRLPLKFGAFFFDYDLDGRLDLLTNNGHIEPGIADIQSGQTYAQAPQLFWNTGDGERLYEAVTAKDAGDDLFRPLVGRGCAFGDLNGDGNLDVVLIANGGPARLLRNEYKGGNRWARLRLKGDGKRANTSAIGAQVTIKVGDRTMQRQVTAGRGYLSQSEFPITVGLGAGEKIDSVTVRWPCREKHEETWTNLEKGKTHELSQGKGK